MRRIIGGILVLTVAFLQISAKQIQLSTKIITGLVVENECTPIEFANVTAFWNDSVVSGAITDSSGQFKLEISDRCNRIRVSFVGYDDLDITPSCRDIGKIVLHQTSTTIKEVVVKAPLIRREADRIILNVSANPLFANKDAQELLKTAPGVWTTDEALSIYGQTGTTVYIDDRKVNMTGTQLIMYLKTLQSSTIASIEIIPKAGAEYSADSSGGVIKINLKKNRFDGLTGSTGVNTTFGKYKLWLNPLANVNLHNGKWTFNLEGNFNGSPYDRYITHENSNNFRSVKTLNGISHHKNHTLQGNLMFGAFYDPSDKDRIGVQLDNNHDNSNGISTSETVIKSTKSTEVTSGRYDSKNHFANFNVALNWSHTLDSKGSVLKWISNYNYQVSKVDENNKMSWSDVSRDSLYSNINSNYYNIFVSELSASKMFKQGCNLNIGAKYTFNDMSYKSLHTYIKDDDFIRDIRYDYDNSYDENILAIYAVINGQAGRWRYKGGLRGEYFNTKGFSISDSRFNLFPNANISFNLTEKGDYTAALGYYRNIRRPSFWSLSPIVRQVSDYSYSVGNMELTPSYTDAISLDFVLASRFTLASGYSHTENAIRQMFKSISDYPERMYLTWNNEGKDQSFFIHGDGFLNITEWWNLYSSVTYVLTSQKLDDNNVSDTFGYVQIVGSSTFILPKGFNLTMNCFYNSKMKIGNIDVYPILNVNPTIQKRFGNNWSVSFGLDNIIQHKSKIRTLSSGYDRLTFTKNYMTAKLSISYSFNSGKSFNSRRIETNTDGSRLNKE